MVKVSVIVPVYNTKQYLKKCLDSLLEQTMSDIEIIVINDGSTENIDVIIENYNNKKIKYIKKENEGIGKTRNLGINIAKGQYIMFVDSDDYVDKNYVKSLYEAVHNNNSDVGVCDFYKLENSKLELNHLPTFATSSLAENSEMIFNVYTGVWNKIFKKSILVNNNITFVEDLKYEDTPFVIKAINSAKSVTKIDEPLYIYIIHEKSQTTTIDSKIFDIFSIVNIMYDYAKQFDYLIEPVRELITEMIINYSIDQRLVDNKKMRDTFIDKAFTTLDKINPNWRNSNKIKNNNWLKKKFKRNKFLFKLYVDIAHLKYKK